MDAGLPAPARNGPQEFVQRGLLLGALALMALIALLVGIIWFLAALWKCAGLYDGLPPKDAGLENL